MKLESYEINIDEVLNPEEREELTETQMKDVSNILHEVNNKFVEITTPRSKKSINEIKNEDLIENTYTIKNNRESGSRKVKFI